MKLLTLVFLMAGMAQAEVLDEVNIRGSVYNISPQVVSLKTVTGVVYLPKKYFKGSGNLLRPNQAVSVKASLREVIRFNRDYKKAHKF